ncbi:Maf family protein [Planctomycetota bacterium]
MKPACESLKITLPPGKIFVLASASPRRSRLLKKILADFHVAAAGIDEEEILSRHTGSTPEAAARHLAEAKASRIATGYDNALILGSDTLVVTAGGILGKPVDAADARRILQILSGSTHRIITGLCLIDTGSGKSLLQSEATSITMMAMSAEQISDYVKSGEPFGKAGAYAIQENGDQFVTHIDGNFDNIVGLPTRLTAAMIREIIS